MSDVDLRQLAIDRDVTPSAPAGNRRHLMTRFLLPVLLLLGFLTLVTWASRDLLFPPVKVTVIPVYTTEAEVQREGTPLFKAAGWIEPRPTPIRVAALAPGVVEKLLVVEDQPIHQGDPIAELVKDDARLAHQRALADFKLKEAELEQARAKQKSAITRFEQPVHLSAALGEAEANLAKIGTQLKNLPFESRRATAQLEYARKNHAGKLAAKGAVSGRAIDAALSELEKAKAHVEELQLRDSSLKQEQQASQIRRDALKKQLELLADETRAKDEAAALVKAARARLEQAEVIVSETQLRLDRMTVRAPVDGRVYRLVGHPGSRIGAGITHLRGHDSSTIITLYQPDKLQIRVDVRFEDIPKTSLNQPVQIDNPALKAPLLGKVLFVSSEADIQKNTLQVKVEIPAPPEVFKPEMLVDVTFLASQETSSQTEANLRLRRRFLILVTSLPTGILARIQLGFLGITSVGITLTGIRETLSAPRNFSPATTFAGFFFAAFSAAFFASGLLCSDTSYHLFCGGQAAL